MSHIIGIDLGGSTTKIVGLSNGSIIGAAMVRASDPVTSAYGAFGRFLEDSGLRLTEIDRVMCTGVGSSFLKDNIYGIPTEKVDEFMAIGLGGRHISGLDHCVVVSMGTGTSLTHVCGDQISYINGSGVGGGTILGLCSKMLGSRSYEHIAELALRGNAEAVDLTVGDITRNQLANMNNKTTASNFGQANDDASDADFAMGVINMVFQTVGIFAMMAAREHKADSIVLTGTLSRMEAAKPVIRALEELYGVHYIVPEHSEFCTAIGAALYGERE